jgi:hypothetical protein
MGWTDPVWRTDRQRSQVEFQKLGTGKGGPGSSVGLATGYGLEGPGIESRWGEIFLTCPDRP